VIDLLLVAVFTYIIAALFQIHILFKLAYFFLGLHLLIKFYHYNIGENLVLSHQLKEDHIFLNEEIECQINVENNSRLPVLWLKIEEVLPRELIPAEKKEVSYLAPGEFKSWQVSIKGRRRGLYNIGPLEWEAGDMLGYDMSQGFLKKLPFYVFPRLLTLEELGLPSRLPFGDIKWPQPIYKDPYQMVGIREYQPSDKMNKIHWKATARTGKLQSRENQSTVSLELALVLNLSQFDYGLKRLERKTELAITAAASLAYYFNRIGQSFSFKTNGTMAIPDEKDFIQDEKVFMQADNDYIRDEKDSTRSLKNKQDIKEGIGSSSQDTQEGNKTIEKNRNFEKISEDNFKNKIYREYVTTSAGSGELHLQSILEIMACLELSKEDNFIDLLSGHLDLSWGGTVIVLTDKDSSELIQAANNLISRGYSVKIMLFGDRVEHPEYLHRPFTAPLSINHLRREEDIYGLSRL